MVWMTLTHLTVLCDVVRRMVSRVKVKMAWYISLESRRPHTYTCVNSPWVNVSKSVLPIMNWDHARCLAQRFWEERKNEFEDV